MFAPVLPDECQVNPGVFGAELAFWLCADLARRGLATSYPEHEDWGWYIEYVTPAGAEFAIHCGNIHGEDNLWLLSLRRLGRKMFGRDKPWFDEAAALVEAVRTGIAAAVPEQDIAWLYEGDGLTH